MSRFLSVSFLCVIFSFQAMALEVVDQVKCDKLWGNKQILPVEKMVGSKGDSLAISVETSCADDSHKVLNLVEGDFVTRIGELFVPYSYGYKLKNLVLAKRNVFLFYLDVSEPNPTNSYYYAFIDLDFKVILYSGYSDSSIEVRNIDNREGLEVIVGKNLTGIDPLELLIDYVPEPKIFSWGCYYELQVYEASHFPHYYLQYEKNLIEYKTKLNGKKREGLNKRVQRIINNELGMIDILLSRHQLSSGIELKCGTNRASH